MSDLERPLLPSRNRATEINWLLVILLILMAGFLWRSQWSRNVSVDKPIIPRGDLAADELATIELFKQVSPSVVHIMNLAVRRDMADPQADALGIPQGSGSGFVWNEDGYIVTNWHVIETATAAKVTLADRSQWDSRIVGKAEDKDIAVLKIDAPAERLHPIRIGTSENLQVGQKVFAIGNPFGLDQTLTTGVISGLGREILSVTKRPIQGVIQTDAAVNPGNSGGPLLDSAGLAIGVNTAIFSPSGTNAGIGFAVPVDTLGWIVPQLIRHGKVERIGMGVLVFDDVITFRQLGLQGVLINEVRKGSPAAAAGIRPTVVDGRRLKQLGDLIVAVNDKPIRTSIDLFRILDQYKAGDKVTLTVRREGAEVVIPVTLNVLADD
jgi:S1-C subfamily serine protease